MKQTMKKVLLTICLFFLILMRVNAEDITRPTLTKLLVDGVEVLDFSPETLEYKVTVSKETEKIVLGYEAAPGFKAKHTGPLKLSPGENKYEIEVSKPDDSEKVVYTLIVIREDLRSSNNYLSTLTVGGKEIPIEQDKTDYEVYVESGATKVSITAIREALNSSFVEGYGERTGSNAVSLEGEKTEVEIKVKAENEEVRTYHITIIKSDYKSNDNSLKSLKIEEIPFNFQSSIYEYNLEVENDTQEINLEAFPNDEKATVTYNKKEKLKEGINKIEIKVEAQDTSLKTYTLNVTRKEATSLVDNIEIENLILKFNPTIYNYEIETNLDTLKFKVDLTKKSSTLKIKDNKNLVNGSVVKLEVTDGSKKVVYSFKIKKNNILNDTNLLTADVSLKETSLKKYEMYIALGALGIGVFATLTAILTKPKKEENKKEQ